MSASPNGPDPLFGETFYPVARPDIAARIGRLEDMFAHDLYEIVTLRTNWMQILALAGARSETGLRLRHVDSSLVAFAMAGTGAGIALARAPATDALEMLHGLVSCLPGFEMKGSQDYHLVYPTRAGLSRPARAFRDWLLAEARGQE